MDSDTYDLYCPPAASPTVFLMGTVEKLSEKMDEGPFRMRCDVRATVYDASAKDAVSFTVAAYFRIGRRWINFPPPTPNTYLMISGSVIGTNGTRLAIWIEDIYPMSNILHTSIPSSSQTLESPSRTPRKRWANRAPSTPSKRPRIDDAQIQNEEGMEEAAESAGPEEHQTRDTRTRSGRKG